MRERRPGNEAKIRPPLYKGQNYMATIEGYYCSPKSVLYSEITLYYCVSHLITSVVKKICQDFLTIHSFLALQWKILICVKKILDLLAIQSDEGMLQFKLKRLIDTCAAA